MDGGERADALHRRPAPVHLASFYKYCEQEQLVDRNPARPSRPGARRGTTALASLLALNGLRISEALGADIESLDFERGHRTLKIVRKGN